MGHHIEEILDFVQDDLCDNDVMMLDTCKKVRCQLVVRHEVDEQVVVWCCCVLQGGRIAGNCHIAEGETMWEYKLGSGAPHRILLLYARAALSKELA